MRQHSGSLAEHVARLADTAQQLAEREQRQEREQRARQLYARWGDPVGRAGLATYLKAIPGLAAKFDRIVPGEFVAQAAEGQYAVLCPCGESPMLAPGELRGCGCGRWFLHDGADVHVALSPVGTEPGPNVYEST